MNPSNQLRFKSFKAESFDAETGEVEGYASKFNNVDQHGDIIVPGAFAKSLANGPTAIRFLAHHDKRRVIGVITELKEDELGLRFKAQFAPTQDAQEIRSLYRMGAMDSFSIGFVPIIEERQNIKSATGKLRSVNVIKEMRLFEISSVAFAANTEAKLNAIKSYGDRRFDELTMDEQGLATKFMDWLIDQREKAANDAEIGAVTTSDEVEETPAVETPEEAPESVNEDELELKQLREQLELATLRETLRRATKG